VVNRFVFATLLACVAGCGIRADRARNGPLPYHPNQDQPRASSDTGRTPQSTQPRRSSARLVNAGFARAYPQPVGLSTFNDGAGRKVIGIEWGDGSVEAGLAVVLQQRLVGADEVKLTAVHVGGGLVEFAQYRFGDRLYASGRLELRAMREGTEIYAARYATTATGSSSQEVSDAIIDDISNQVLADQLLFGTIEGALP
jgi:hypothetical protein